MASGMPLLELRHIIRLHDTGISCRVPKAGIIDALRDHHCDTCESHVTLLKTIPIFSVKAELKSSIPLKDDVEPELKAHSSVYPPAPLDSAREASIIQSCMDSMQPNVFQESGCCVCGQLTLLNQLSLARHISRFFTILDNDECTHQERFSSEDPIVPLPGPVVDKGTDLIYLKCRASVCKGVVPRHALSKGLWLGEVPEVLSRLSFVERLLVACVRHSCCLCVSLWWCIWSLARGR